MMNGRRKRLLRAALAKGVKNRTRDKRAHALNLYRQEKRRLSNILHSIFRLWPLGTTDVGDTVLLLLPPLAVPDVVVDRRAAQQYMPDPVISIMVSYVCF